jgi:ATP-dependent DNA helicase PIF1
VCRFAKYLLQIGEDKAGDPVTIDNSMLLPITRRSITDLIKDVYGDVATFPLRASSLSRHAIVTPKNKHVDALNDMIIDGFPGVATEYHAHDTPINIADEGNYNPAFFAMQKSKGLPPAVLRLKVGMPVMLLRNLDPAAGLANGTRLTITKLDAYLVHACILTGDKAGTAVMIPRISLHTDEKEALSVQFSRRQYPLRPAFVITINKAQGQTLDRIGIYLPGPVFSHGQLYVAMSRAGAADRVKFLLEEYHLQTCTTTSNIVYRELFLIQ